ncbi:MAG TPA: hypothetical protein ENN51_03440 [candidate division WOR-3 bacterium]|uniref:Uncharacterized protein n=1 Tax=candidate division WOR-3 bacterium TaxID=2052148 RepID=A0A7V0XES6_UNCW3|nr:hypothetical protein [candidate division WOR-3 bacterium]
MGRLVVVFLFLLVGCTADVLVTQEPESFFGARPLRPGQMDLGVRMMQHGQVTNQPVFYGIGAGYGLGRDWEARAGWALAGWHWRASDSTQLLLNAVELRGRRQLLEDGPFRLAAGGGCDLFLGDPGGGRAVEYYGFRPMLQAAAGVYTDVGFGLFVPLAVSGTFLRPEQAVGWSITPGAGVALEQEYFFLRVACNLPFGRFIEGQSHELRTMAPSAGLELGGRFNLFGGR